MSYISGGGGGGGGATRATLATAYFVSTTGNDTHTGTTLGTAWLTLQHAMNFISAGDGKGQNIIVHIGAGAFAGFGIKDTLGINVLQFIGAGSANTTITTGPNDGVFNFGESVSNYAGTTTAIIGIDKVTFDLTLTAGGTVGIEIALPGANFNLGNAITFVAADVGFKGIEAVARQDYIEVAFQCQFVVIAGVYTITTTGGTFDRFWFLQELATVFDGGTWTISGPADTLTTAFIVAENGGCYVSDSLGTSYAGAITGKRFKGVNNASFGGGDGITLGLTFFPGSTAGTLDSSSSYDGVQTATAVGITINTTTITGGISGRALFDNAATVGEASNFNIISGNPNVISGHAYLTNGTTFAWQDLNNNVVLGDGGNFGVISGIGNTGIGHNALGNITSGTGNLAIGNGTCILITTGQYNMAFGSDALSHETTGADNVAIGHSVLAAQNGVTGNVGIGASALQHATGSLNTAIGFQAAQADTVGAGNIAIGYQSLNANTTGNFNIVIGVQSTDSLIGANNTVIGSKAARSLASGNDNNNTFIGFQAGTSLTSGNNNTFIGNYTGPAGALSGNIVLSDGAGTIRAQADTNGSWTIARSFQIGAPTGGDEGAGTINVATGIFLNGTAYTNPKWVLKYHFTGTADRDGPYAPPAPYHGLRSIDETETFMREKFELPLMTMLNGKQDLFKGSDLLLASLEEAYLHIISLNKRITKLEMSTWQRLINWWQSRKIPDFSSGAVLHWSQRLWLSIMKRRPQLVI